MKRTLEDDLADLVAALEDFQIALGEEILRVWRRLKALLHKGF